MLRPDERSHLLELLRPPAGYLLDQAIGTTFSLDLLSALMLPLSFAFFDWEHADGKPVADPLALLEALRKYGDQFTIFCQAGQIRLPAKYPPLVTFLEPCVYEVQAPDPEGVFHPKVWALRFVGNDGMVRYRILCLSRNLTFDRCWDTVVALDGDLEDRVRGIAANHPLGDFIQHLPKLSLKPVTPERRKAVSKVADELRRVRFTWPEGFDEKKCKFWVGGLDGRETTPFGSLTDKCLIVSPFLSDAVIQNFVTSSKETHIVSRLESLQELPNETLRACTTVHYLQPQETEETADEAPEVGHDEVLDGLHAKLFVIDRGWNASVFTGSFNATVHALKHNVELMVELVGKRSRCGVEQFLQQRKGETTFADLLQKYDANIEASLPDPNAREMDQLFQAVKRALAASKPLVRVTPAAETEHFDMAFSFKRMLRLPRGKIEVRAWPITQKQERAQVLTDNTVFSRLSYEGLTPLIAFAVTAEVNGAKGQSVFVMNLPIEGAPEDRNERLLASMLAGQDQLLRYILFLLAAGDENAASSGHLADLLTGGEIGETGPNPSPCLLETMLRALHRDPAQLERVASLLEALRKAPNGSTLLSPEFQQIWESIWAVAQEGKKK